jgi:hypothetical protein
MKKIKQNRKENLTVEQKSEVLHEMTKFFKKCIKWRKDEIKLFERNYNNLFKIKSIDDLSMFKHSKIWEGDYYYTLPNGNNIDIDGELFEELKNNIIEKCLFEQFGFLSEVYENFGMK